MSEMRCSEPIDESSGKRCRGYKASFVLTLLGRDGMSVSFASASVSPSVVVPPYD